jgi:ABC-type cobalamin/Fe3+-siderophores transport system ATPase subunit
MNFLRMARARDLQVVEESLRRVQMWEFRDRQIGELSGGQKKRVFLARALAQEARLILLDEPFTGVDVKTEAAIVDLLRELRTAGHIMLVSTHNLGSVPEFCDHAVLINRTDAGDINYTSISSLTVEGATTVNGSIAFTAPDLKVTGGIATVGANTDVTLTASTNNLFIDGTVTSQRDVTLNAVGGSITSSTAGRTTLITAPRNVIVAADKTATLLTKAQALTATLTSVGSTLDVQDDDGLVITSAILSGGGNATFKVGTAALGGSTLVGLILRGSSAKRSHTVCAALTEICCPTMLRASVTKASPRVCRQPDPNCGIRRFMTRSRLIRCSQASPQ